MWPEDDHDHLDTFLPTTAGSLVAGEIDPDLEADELEYAYGQPEALIHYVMDLEGLVRWFALLYRRDYWSPEEDGCTLDHPHDGDHHHEEIGDPIWTVYDERGTHLAAAEKLQETWNRVMHDA